VLAQDQNVVHLAGTGDKIAPPLVAFALRGKPAAVAQLALNRAVGIGSVAAYWSNPVIIVVTGTDLVSFMGTHT
jgi:hypothetical protein